MEKIAINKDELLDDCYISESLLCGILWNNPSLYSTYTSQKLSVNHLGNKIWKYYLGLGRTMYEKGINVFDDIAVEKAVTDSNTRKLYKSYGEFDTIYEMMNVTKESIDNFEAYYEDIKKYALLRGLRNLFGDRVVKQTKKYNYKEMKKQEIENYWLSKLTDVQMENGDFKIKGYNLVENLNELIDKVEDEENQGIPFYNMERFTEIMDGWAKGTVYLLSAFSGMGKSSFVVFAIILSFILHKKKLIILANEMDLEAYQKLLLISIMGTPLHDELYSKYQSIFPRTKLNKGNFTKQEKSKLERAIEWMKEHIEDNELIVFVPLENYTMDSVEQTLRHYKRKGYDYAVIDTAKPSENRGSKDRWVQFVDDYETIYKLARKDTLDMGIFTTVQNADNYTIFRFLDYTVIGDGKKIKNTVDFCTHIRLMFDTEKSGDTALKVYDDNGKQVKINPMLNYYLFFVSKNRRGRTNSSGDLPILVMQVDLNTNKWKEIGWTKVTNDLK